jgi:hypothetical protein
VDFVRGEIYIRDLVSSKSSGGQPACARIWATVESQIYSLRAGAPTQCAFPFFDSVRVASASGDRIPILRAGSRAVKTGDFPTTARRHRCP